MKPNMKIDIGISDPDRAAIAQALSKLLADSYTLYLKTHNYHWNVTGPMFNTLHLMFEQQYTELATAVDLIAERIRALGHTAPGSYRAYAGLTDIAEDDEVPPAPEMIAGWWTARRRWYAPRARRSPRSRPPMTSRPPTCSPSALANPDYNPKDKKSKKFFVDFDPAAIQAAKGMTHYEIENAMSLSLIETSEKYDEYRFDPTIIGEIKKQQVKKSAVLEISAATHKFEDVIGMEHLKNYLTKVAMNSLAQGIMIVGVQGTGKTYIAEGLANEIGIPAVTVSFEKIMGAGGGIVGQAQQQAINTFKTLDAMSPCIAIMDEIEKGLAGIQSSGRTDSGSNAGVGSIFLKWIEKKSPGIYRGCPLFSNSRKRRKRNSLFSS